MKFFRMGGSFAASLLLFSLAISPAFAQKQTQLTIAIQSQPPGLDTHINTVAITNDLARHIFEGLVTMDDKLQIKPALASSWDVSDDGKTYVFHLRNGVKFHNGAALTAKDVVASMQRWSRYSNPGRLTFPNATWTATDDATVKLEVPAASYKILFALGNAYNQPAAVMPASVVEGAGEKPTRDIVGTGPYRLKEWVPDQYLTLEKFSGYTPTEGPANGWSGNKTASIDTLRFEFVADDATRVLGLQTGKYQVVPNVPYDSVQVLRGDRKVKIVTYPFTSLFVITNKANGIFKDVRARKAMDMAINKEDVLFAAASSEDLFTRNYQLMSADQKSLWDTHIGKEEYYKVDAKQAQMLLKDVGYDGREIVMITSRDNSSNYNAAVMIQEQLRAIGLKVRLDVYDWPTFVDVRAKREGWDMQVVSNTYKVDPTHWLHLAKPYSGFTNDPALDNILERFNKAKDWKEAGQLYDDLMKWHVAYVPATKVGDTSGVVAYTASIPDLPVMGGPLYWRVQPPKQ